MFFNGILFLMLLESLICGLCLRMMCRGLWLNAFALLVSFLFLVKCFEKKAGQKIKFFKWGTHFFCPFIYPSVHQSI